ncbi:hypothetical protein MHYP_G00176560 [Metynnis hypsauchen]
MLHPCYVHIYTSFMATRYTSEQSPTTFPGRVGSPSTKLIKNAEPRSPARPLNHSRRVKNRVTADCVRNCDEYGQWRETDLSKMVHSQTQLTWRFGSLILCSTDAIGWKKLECVLWRVSAYVRFLKAGCHRRVPRLTESELFNLLQLQ